MMFRLLIALFFITSLQIYSGTYYVDPLNGNDSNAGTLALPFKTITKGLSTIGSAGGTLYLRGGTYSYSSSINMSLTASSSSYIQVWAYNNENPLIDFSSQALGSDGFKISGKYYHLKGLEIMGSGHNGINISGHYNIIENCRIHTNRNTGLQIGSSSGITYPSNNLILNTDAYLNYDPPIGGNADGFGFKWNVGANNKYVGCRAYNNSDDGWDLWMAIDSVEIDSCFAYRNGVDVWGQPGFDGNGNGFKLGGNNVARTHYVHNCVSFDNTGNGGRGYDENNNLAGQIIYNCVAYRNTGDNFHLVNTVTTGQHLIKNCISLNGVVNISSGIRTNNSWNGFTPSSADFMSIDTALANANREPDGSLPSNGFFRLKETSQFVNAGTDVGILFNGSAPDIGAFEFIPGLPVELFYFSSITNANGINLTWKTATENDNAGFVVERSSDNLSWREIGYVKGHGNSYVTNEYNFYDLNPANGKLFYRLKQIDLDGSYTYSDIITASTVVKGYTLEQNYPNPFNPSTTIKYSVPLSGNVKIILYDELGKEISVLVNEAKEPGNYSYQLSAINLSNGVYFYKLTSGGYSSVKKLIVLK